jgi:prepilin-type N-terminal cleavage/methylation domain-containing protein
MDVVLSSVNATIWGYVVRKGFSLVELSIALVIIGLITGGILAGQSLLGAAELKAVITESDKYISSAKLFRQKYGNLPGDFPNAEATWGTADPVDANCITTAAVGTETCNGDENGRITGASTRSNESYRFWQHLANAGLITGKYDGITHGSTNFSSTADNSPASKFTSGGWFIWSWSTASGHTAFFDGFYDNTLCLGKGWNANSWPTSGLFKPEELWNVDTKTDDGKPATGKLVAYIYANCTDAGASPGGASVLTANYDLSRTTAGCVAMWPNAFERK